MHIECPRYVPDRLAFREQLRCYPRLICIDLTWTAKAHATLLLPAQPIRTASEPHAIATAVRRELHAVDGNVPASSVRTMDQFLTASVAPRKFNLELMMIFAGAALLLAALGLYGVVSYAVILRTPEIGIRMALGADRYSILRLIVGQGLRLVLIGTAAGLLAAVGVERAARNLLFETSASDPVVFAAVAVVFVAVGTIAAYVPARRALRVNPLTTLQSE